ncbi:hypothetical protein [Micromonospora sp. NPDC005189]|uniref:hypothetical protein n=1 Tax=unclassified Micromonospora TaxID=2617518 RepID=UPI0033A1DDF6
MGLRLRRVAMMLLGAILLGTVGLSVGSWYGGRGVTPLGVKQARNVAAELLPDAEPYDSNQIVHGIRWGVGVAADDLGSGQVNFSYLDRDDCALSERLQRNAAAQRWQGLRREPGYRCDGWRAERDGLTVTLDNFPSGSRLTVAPAPPDRFLAVTIGATVMGAAAGAVLFWLLARRRPPVPLLVGTLVTVGLLPGVALTWWGLDINRLTEPVWPVWPALAPLLLPLWLVLLAVGVFAVPRRQHRPEAGTGAADASAEAAPTALPPARGDTRTVVVVTVACVLIPLVLVVALVFLFLRAQPDRAALQAPASALIVMVR